MFERKSKWIKTWLNKDDHQEFQKKLEETGSNEYAQLKNLVLAWIYEN